MKPRKIIHDVKNTTEKTSGENIWGTLRTEQTCLQVTNCSSVYGKQTETHHFFIIFICN